MNKSTPRSEGLYRCKVCGTRWLLWPDSVHGGGWNLLDQYQQPGPCCDNVAMGEQIEHLRDLPTVGAERGPQERTGNGHSAGCYWDTNHWRCVDHCEIRRLNERAKLAERGPSQPPTTVRIRDVMTGECRYIGVGTWADDVLRVTIDGTYEFTLEAAGVPSPPPSLPSKVAAEYPNKAGTEAEEPLVLNHPSTATPCGQETAEAIERIAILGMSPCDLDCLSPDEDAALRVLLRAIVREHPTLYELDPANLPPPIDFAECEARTRAEWEADPAPSSPSAGWQPDPYLCTATCQDRHLDDRGWCENCRRAKAARLSALPLPPESK